MREDDTVLQSVLPLVGQDEQAARGLLGRFQFGPDEVEKRVEMLSGGERSRLRLLTLLVGDANFLLLDEPTNHLDMGSVEALADALEDYTGTILLVTHDRHLIDRVATRVLEIHDDRLLNHLSATRYWETRNERLGIAPAAPEEPARGGRRAATAAPAGAAVTRGKESAEEARRRRARLRGVERRSCGRRSGSARSTRARRAPDLRRPRRPQPPARRARRRGRTATREYAAWRSSSTKRPDPGRAPAPRESRAARRQVWQRLLGSA